MSALHRPIYCSFYIALFLGDKSGIRININLLALLEDIHAVRTYAWGAGGLVFLYRQLGLASRAHIVQVTRYLTLL